MISNIPQPLVSQVKHIIGGQLRQNSTIECLVRSTLTWGYRYSNFLYNCCYIRKIIKNSVLDDRFYQLIILDLVGYYEISKSTVSLLILIPVSYKASMMLLIPITCSNKIMSYILYDIKCVLKHFTSLTINYLFFVYFYHIYIL